MTSAEATSTNANANRRRQPPEASRSGPAVVTIHVPASPEYFVILRAACSHLATRAGRTWTAVRELRLATDEACRLLLRNCVRLGGLPERNDLAATFLIDGASMRITLRMTADASLTPDDEDFGWAVLRALVDDCSWRVEGSTVLVEIRSAPKPARGGREE